MDIETVLQAYDQIGDNNFIHILLYYKWFFFFWFLLILLSIFYQQKKDSKNIRNLIQGLIVFPLFIGGSWVLVLLTKGWETSHIEWQKNYARPYYETLSTKIEKITDLEYKKRNSSRRSSYWLITFMNEKGEEIVYTYEGGVTKMSEKEHDYVTYKEIDHRLAEKLNKEYPFAEMELYITDEVYNQYRD